MNELLDVYKTAKELFNRDQPPTELECFVALNNIYNSAYVLGRRHGEMYVEIQRHKGEKT